MPKSAADGRKQQARGTCAPHYNHESGAWCSTLHLGTSEAGRLPRAAGQWKKCHDRVERAQGLLAAHQGADADQPAAVRRRAHRAPALRGRAQRQAHPRHAARLFPRRATAFSSSRWSRWRCSSTARTRSITGTARTKTSDRHGLHRAHPAGQSAAGDLLRHLHCCLRVAGADGADVRAAGHCRSGRAAFHVWQAPSCCLRPSACWPRRARRTTISFAGAECRPSSTGWCWPSARLAAPVSWP